MTVTETVRGPRRKPGAWSLLIHADASLSVTETVPVTRRNDYRHTLSLALPEGVGDYAVAAKGGGGGGDAVEPGWGVR